MMENNTNLPIVVKNMLPQKVKKVLKKTRKDYREFISF